MISYRSGESLASQYQVHQEWGGIRPNIATREHRKVIGSVLQDALDKYVLYFSFDIIIKLSILMYAYYYSQKWA